jgi:hypothetical protein
MNVEVIQIEGILLVVPLKELSRIPGNKITERGCEVVHIVNNVAHMFELNIFAIAWEDAMVGESVQSYKYDFRADTGAICYSYLGRRI